MSLAEHAGDRRTFAYSKAESTVRKRTVLIGKLNTSVSLEDEFWEGLRTVAADRGLTVGKLLREIDAQKGPANLSSAARVWLLRHFQQRMVVPAQ